MTFLIRPARIDDADAIASVHHRAWEETYPGLMPPELLERMSFERRLAQWRRIIHNLPPGHFRCVAEIDSAVIGIGQCGPAREQELAARHEIWMIYVLRAAQGRGVGTALMRDMFGFIAARDAGAGEDIGDASVGLWVLANNARAIRFYEKLGARKTARIKRDERMGVVIEDVGMRWEATPI